MSELKLVSPLLDDFVMGNPMSSHDGIRCCPAMRENTDEKYIVKVISIPESQVQLDALLLTGAYKDPAEATDYFKEVADSITAEVEILNTLAKLEGFLPYEGCQVVPMENGKLGYDIYLLSHYRRSLLRHMQKNPITHLEAINLGLDLCTALAICRRAGYLYVDLKPGNIFLSKEKQYRIGDLGFVRLDSLGYTSLPGKYRSPYAPAEVQDDLKVLNETVDTYAVGMILYQIYNEGTLPASPLEPKDPFPHPANADYEISSIIMKALDPDPARRWPDPIEMGQALVGYMQRNSVNNVPITPPSGIVTAAEPVCTDSDSAADADREDTQEAVPVPPEEPAEAPQEASASTEEISVQEATVPDASDNSQEEIDDDLDFSIAFSDSHPEEKKQPAKPITPKTVPVRKPRKQHGKAILSAILVLLILACLGCGAYWFYQTQYLLAIDNMTLKGTQNELTVTIDTKMNTDLLQVTCTDAYGNTIIQDVVNGQAVFHDLLPDSLYRIELTVDGFHELTGKTAEIFTTDAIPSIVSMSAVTGAEDGSAIVNFTVDGTDPDEWLITCTADGEETITETFTGHSVTVKRLTVGKQYVLTLSSTNGEEIEGSNRVDFIATQLVMAENLMIADCTDGVMTVRWDAPADVNVESWTVRCYTDDGHEEVLEIAGTEIAFTGIDNTRAYTVEVTAAGMTQANRVSISANPLTITELTVNTEDPDQITVSWTHEGTAPDGGWLLLYTLDHGQGQQNVVKCDSNSAVIETRVPSTKYNIEIQAVDSTSIFNNLHNFTCPAADVFENQGLSANKITSHLVKTPDQEDWTIDSIGEDAYTDTFQAGDSISIVLTAGDNFYLPEMDIDVMYVIRDGKGNVLSDLISTETIDWKDLWYDDDYHNGELTIPEAPQDPGDYSVSVYFNDLSVTVINFTIQE